jgi:hypothetical protein
MITTTTVQFTENVPHAAVTSIIMLAIITTEEQPLQLPIHREECGVPEVVYQVMEIRLPIINPDGEPIQRPIQRYDQTGALQADPVATPMIPVSDLILEMTVAAHFLIAGVQDLLIGVVAAAVSPVVVEAEAAEA